MINFGSLGNVATYRSASFIELKIVVRGPTVAFQDVVPIMAPSQLSLPRDIPNQLRRYHPEGVGQVEHDRERRHVLSALDEADVAHVQVCQFGEPLLRQAALGA